MKNLSKKQIEEVKQIQNWASVSFHANRKRIGSLFVSDFKKIVEKKKNRELIKLNYSPKTDIQKIKQLLKQSINNKGNNYFKILIEGNSGIYYAHPIYQHRDYNKSRIFDKNEKTLKLMRLFNQIINKISATN